MLSIEIRDLRRYVQNLEGMGCSFKIIAPNGDEFGDLEVAQPKNGKAPLKYKKGTLRNFYKPQINFDLPIGKSQVVLCGDFDPLQIQSGLCSLLSSIWGPGTYSTGIKGNTVELRRES